MESLELTTVSQSVSELIRNTFRCALSESVFPKSYFFQKLLSFFHITKMHFSYIVQDVYLRYCNLYLYNILAQTYSQPSLPGYPIFQALLKEIKINLFLGEIRNDHQRYQTSSSSGLSG